MEGRGRLWTPLSIRGLETRNRVFLSPMCQYSAVEGLPQAWHRRHYLERALGGVGLVILEATAVLPEGRISPADLGLWNAEQEGALASLVAAIHETGAKAAVQLAHAGRKASTKVPWKPGPSFLGQADGGWQTLGPSPLAFDTGYAPPREMAEAELGRVVSAFAESASRAVRAGFDAVELHAAHGYLLHQFLSPLTNHRTDRYGGSPGPAGLGGRLRLTAMVVEAVRGSIPAELPLFLRLSATDWTEGGWGPDEGVELLKGLRRMGLDLVDVSSGGLLPAARVPVAPGYQLPFAGRFRKETGLATASVGLFTEEAQMEAALESGMADAIILGRLLLRDPYWPLRNAPAQARPCPPQYLRAF